MMYRFTRLLAIGAVLAAVGMAGAAPATTALADSPSTDPAGEITLPPLYGPDLPILASIAGSPAGLAWQFGGYDDMPSQVYYSGYGDGQTGDAGNIGSNGFFSLAGSQLRLSSDNVAKPEPGIDITTGTSIPNPAYNGGSWSIGDGTLSDAQNNNSGTYQLVRTDNSGSVVATYPPLLIDGTAGFDQIWVQAADPQGAVIEAIGSRGSGSALPGTLDYLDFATGDYTVLDDTQYAETDTATLSADDVVWTHGGHALYLARDDLTATPAAASPDGGIHYLALSGDQLGYQTSIKAPDGGKSIKTIKTGTLGGTTFTAVDNTLPKLGPIVTADNGDFAVVAGDTLADFGVYRLHPGDTALGANLVRFGPTPPLGIDASAGRILTVLSNAEAHPAEQTKLASSDGKVTASQHHSEIIKQTTANLAPDPSGGNTAYLEQTGHSENVVVLDGTKVIDRLPVPEGSYHVTMSGNLLLLPHFANVNTATNGAVVINLDDGSTATAPESEALYGDTESYIGDGGIHQLDLTTGADTLIPNSSDCTGDPEQTVLSADGDWVFCDVSQSDGASMAFNISTGQRVDVPTTAALYDQTGTGDNDVILADGLVAWIDATDRSVHVFDLTTQQDQVVGVAYPAVAGHQYLALNDDFVAWVAQDDTTRVVPLDNESTAAPRYIGSIAKPDFSSRLKGADASFRPQINTDRPLTHWTMAIHNSRGRLVRTLHGSAPIGGVRPSWNGRSSAGKQEPDGTYNWRLTGSGLTGSLRQSNGSRHAITGRVRLDTKAPTVAIHASKPTRHNGRRVIGIRWSSRSGQCDFTVGYETERVGTTRWSRLHSWLSRTSATSAKLGAVGTPTAVSAKYFYRFVVTATDAAGNRSHPVITASIRG